MKIALVSPYDYFYPGGVNTHISHLLRGLRRRGHDAYVLATIPPGCPIPPYTLPLAGRLLTLSSGGALARINLDPRVIGHIRQLLRQEHFDVVHLHNPLSPLISAGFLYHRPAAPTTTFVGTFHEYRSTPNPVIEVGKPIFRCWIKRLDGRIAVSEAALSFNQALFPGEFTVIPNGVEFARFAVQRGVSDYRPARHRPTILFVGRLEKRKGLSHLLLAFEKVKRGLPQARLRIVGPFTPHAAQPLLKFVQDRRLADVECIGQVSDDALPAFYQTADIFCAPSIDFESFGIVLLEAMAAGTPVVASDIPGYRGVMQSGQQGLLVEPGNPTVLAAALISLLLNPQRRREMGQAGQARAALFDWEMITDQIANFYMEAGKK